MRRIKVILAVVAAVATLMVMAAPAMAQTWWGALPGGSVDVEDCRWVWIPEWDDWFLVCELD